MPISNHDTIWGYWITDAGKLLEVEGNNSHDCAAIEHIRKHELEQDWKHSTIYSEVGYIIHKFGWLRLVLDSNAKGELNINMRNRIGAASFAELRRLLASSYYSSYYLEVESHAWESYTNSQFWVYPDKQMKLMLNKIKTYVT